MIQTRMEMLIAEGLQLRPAALLVQIAGDFQSGIWIVQGDKRVNAKSIMGILSLKLKKGDQFVLMADGDDEMEAVKAIENFIRTGKA